MVLTKFQVKIDEAANNWNRTKDPKYKDLWYKLVKEFANGPHNTKRRIVSISAINKGDDGAYLIVGKSRLFRPCLLYTSPSPRDGLLSRMPSSA